MKNSKLILFESTTACFRLSIDTMYERLKDDGTSQTSVYINQNKETGTFRPSCFLVFTYLTTDFQTTKGIYTTIPHIHKIRNMFQAMYNVAHNDASYISINGETNVSPDYANPLVVDGISKNQDWISLTLTMGSDEGSLVRRPCIAIQHSKSNSFSSLLTLDEFDIIYDIIMHIDFTSIEYHAVETELISRMLLGTKPQVNSRPTAPAYTAPSYNAAPGYQQGYTFGRRQSAPAQAVTPNYGVQMQTADAVVPNQSAPKVYPNVSFTTTTKPATGKLPPRPAEKPVVKKPMMDPQTIESIEVDEDMIDDSALVDEIFNNK